MKLSLKWEKNLSCLKDAVKKSKKQDWLGENICNTHTWLTLVSRIHREFLQLYHNKTHSQLKDLNRLFHERRIMNVQQVHENMLKITNHQGNANKIIILPLKYNG